MDSYIVFLSEKINKAPSSRQIFKECNAQIITRQVGSILASIIEEQSAKYCIECLLLVILPYSIEAVKSWRVLWIQLDHTGNNFVCLVLKLGFAFFIEQNRVNNMTQNLVKHYIAILQRISIVMLVLQTRFYDHTIIFIV